MISFDTAARLQQAGLEWKPDMHDFFAVPQPGLDDRVFVISDMTIDLEPLAGWQAITFNGALEWALDYVLAADALWLPTETQLREILQEKLMAEPQPAVQLVSALDGYRCEIQFEDRLLDFEAVEASEAYARALLYVLDNSQEQINLHHLSA